MPFSGCSALHGVNPNLKKLSTRLFYFFSVISKLVVDVLLQVVDVLLQCFSEERPKML